MILRAIFLVLGCTVLETTEQIFYRKAGGVRFGRKYISLVAPAIAVHLLRLALWYLLLAVLPLGTAIPLLGLNYVVIALTSKLAFNEAVDKRRWLGTALVVAGFVLVAATLE